LVRGAKIRVGHDSNLIRYKLFLESYLSMPMNASPSFTQYKRMEQLHAPQV